jgi:hypothetical protein
MRMSGVPFRLLAPPPSVSNTCERMHRLTDGVDVRIARKSMENPLKIGRTPGTGLVDLRIFVFVFAESCPLNSVARVTVLFMRPTSALFL